MNENSTAYRLRLRVLAKLLLLLAMLAILYVMFSLLVGGKESSRSLASQRVDISSMQPSDVQTVLWEGRPVLVMYRTPAQQSLLMQPEPRLRDANSSRSEQMAAASNAHRSIQPAWFIALAVGTDFGCPVHFLPASDDVFQGQPWEGGFVDECRGNRYDLAGRVFSGQYAEKNLVVPTYSMKEGVVILRN